MIKRKSNNYKLNKKARHPRQAFEPPTPMKLNRHPLHHRKLLRLRPVLRLHVRLNVLHA